MLSCWKGIPHERPGFPHIQGRLAELSSHHPGAANVTLNINPNCKYYRMHGGKKKQSIPPQREEFGRVEEEVTEESTVSDIAVDSTASRFGTGKKVEVVGSICLVKT